MITTILVDDERLARAELKKMLQEHPEIDIIDEAVNVADAIDKLELHKPDLIFLDIQMPGKTGFDLLNEIDYLPQVIFTTAYNEYALKAFEVNALDYLLKPIDSNRLAEAIQKVKKQQSKSNLQKEVYLGEQDQVFVKDGERCWFVKLGEVRLFESAGNYSKVYFDKNRPLILKSLNALEERLDPKMFFRANRKNIINLRCVQKIDPYLNGSLMVKLTGGEEIEVSRRQSVKFKDMLSL
jgi:two-component system LytT family response regulator